MNKKLKPEFVRRVTPTPGQLKAIGETDRVRWSEKRVIEEARKRTKELFAENSVPVARELAKLMMESGWTEQEFLDAMLKDIIAKAAANKQ